MNRIFFFLACLLTANTSASLALGLEGQRQSDAVGQQPSYDTLPSMPLTRSALIPYRAGVFTVKTLPTQALLPVSNIYTAYQDSEGYLWYGTIGGGLCRDNGYQVHVCRPSECAGVAGADNVLCIEEDTRGNIWCLSETGLFCLDKHTMLMNQPFTFEESVSTLGKSSDGHLWVGAEEGVYVLSLDGSKCEVVFRAPDGCRINHFFEDDQQRWFALFTEGVFLWDSSDSTFKKLDANKPMNAMFMAQDTDAAYWVGTWDNGVVHFDMRTGNVTEQPITAEDSDKARCMSLLIDRHYGLLWVTSFAGLHVYRPRGGQLESFDTSAFLSSQRRILGVAYEDLDGNIWVPGFIPHTFIISINQRSVQRTEIQEMYTQTGYPLIADRIVTSGNDMWILQGRVGLMHYDKSTHKLEYADANRRATCLERGKSVEGILTANGRQLLRASYDRLPIFTPIATFPEPITHIMDSGKGTVYIATHRALYAYSLIVDKLQQLCALEAPLVDFCLQGNQLYFILQDKGLYRIAATSNGTSPHVISSSYVFSALAAGGDGTLWVTGTDCNIYSVAHDSLVLEREMSHTCHDPLTDVVCDRRGHVWVLSNQRIREFNPHNHSFRTFTNREMLVSYFFRFEEAEGDSIGVGATGASFVLPSSIELDQLAPTTHIPRITTLLLGDSLIQLPRDATPISIPWNQSTVGFQASTLDVLNASSISFAYRMAESDGEWIYLPEGANIFYLNNLPYGHIHLQLRATDASGCWLPEETTFTIVHQRPWWQTWWAVLLFVWLSIIPLYCLWLIGRRLRTMRLLHRQRRELALTEISAPSQQELLAEKDKQFLAAARDCVERNLPNPQYNVELLASDLCMSRSNLLRRLQPLTGVSPVEFIRDIRLKHAAQLLSERPDLPMNEVTRRVGFASPSYFSKCFKARFGVLPTQWSSETNAEKG